MLSSHFAHSGHSGLNTPAQNPTSTLHTLPTLLKAASIAERPSPSGHLDLNAQGGLRHSASRVSPASVPLFPFEGRNSVLTLLPKPLAQGPSSGSGWSSGPAAAPARALTLALWLQVLGDEPDAETRDVHHRGPARVQPAPGAVRRPEEAVPTLPGAHGLHRGGRQDGHQGVPASVPAAPVELQHGGRRLCLWESPADR